MQRAVQTFHMPTADGWRTVAAGAELADDDAAVTTAPQFFVLVDEQPVKPAPKRATRGRKPSDGAW